MSLSSKLAAGCVLCFDDEAALAGQAASALGMALAVVERHRFPDGETRLRLPAELPARVVLWRGLQQPNEKLVEVLLAAQTARTLGAQHLTLVSPYLAYMRQDIAFNPGEAISQRIVGGFLAGLFDAIITIDPHLHRFHHMHELYAIPAQALHAAGEVEAAIDQLLDLFRRDREWNDGAAKTQLITIFDALKPNDPLVAKGRRRLTSMIFA